jgi:hypothetical protein
MVVYYNMNLIQLFFKNSSKIADLGMIFAFFNNIALITLLHFSQKLSGFALCRYTGFFICRRTYAQGGSL